MAIQKRPSNDIQLLPDNQQYTNRFEVHSETSDRVYTMAQRKSSGQWCCSCPGWIRHRHCKHISAVKEVLPLMEKKRKRLA